MSGTVTITAQSAGSERSAVRSFNAAIVAEGVWASANNAEAEEIAQSGLKYAPEARDHFVSLKRQYVPYAAEDKAFLDKLQTAANWLVERKVLPEAVTVADHAVKV